MIEYAFAIPRPVDAEALHAAIDAAHDLHPYSIRHEDGVATVVIEDETRDPGRAALEQLVLGARPFSEAQAERSERERLRALALAREERRILTAERDAAIVEGRLEDVAGLGEMLRSIARSAT